MKYILNLKSILFTLGLCLFFSCSGDDDNGSGNTPDPEAPWDKNRTAKVLVVSNLSEGNLFSGTDYTSVVNGLKSTEHHISLLDKSNVNFTETSMTNPGINVAYQSGKIPLFVPISKSTSVYTGSTVLFDKPITSLDQVIASDYCWLMKQDVNFTTSLRMNFVTISFNAESQLEAGAAALTSALNVQALAIGVVKRSLAPSLESKLSSVLTAGNYTLELVGNADTGSAYCIYVLASKKWKFRELTETTLTGNIKNFLIQVEYLK
ncbi:MAG: hypothetical protein ACK5M3_13280 [Dysgonomonas sp.]